MTLGSLFDGSGSFPVAGLLSGIVPVWKSEIEPFPIAVTEKRLPFVKHLGDINNINGAEIEPVDIITFGSPCTDLSVAGKTCRVVGYRHGEFVDFDINEALAMQKGISDYQWEVCQSLSHNYDKNNK